MQEDIPENPIQGDGNSRNDRKCCPTINRKYIVPKLFYFCYFAGLGAFLPYLPLFYKQLGLPANRAGIIAGIQPFVSFLFTPVWGFLADRFKKGKVIFVMSFVALVATGVAYLLTPLPPCKDKIYRESRTEVLTERNLSFVDKMSMIMETSQALNRWPVADIAKSQTIESRAHEDQPRSREGRFNVFMYLLMLSLLGTIFSCPGLPLGDTAAVCLLRSHNDVHKYGKQKQWASIGWGTAAFTFGAFVSDRYMCPLVTGQKQSIDYSPCFYGSIVFKLLALFAGLRLDFDMNGNSNSNVESEMKKTNENSDSNVETGTKNTGLRVVLKTVCRPRYLVFFATVLYSGMTFGMIMGFLFWHLEDCAATQIMFSIIPVVRGIADVVVYALSPYVISKLGPVNLIYLVLVGYVTRLICYASITSPWFFLPLEVLSGLTSAGGWAGFVTYISYNSVEGAPATLQGMLHGVYHGVGHGLGRVVGGFLFSSLGARTTFSIFGGLGIIMLIIYVTVNKLAEEKK